MDTKYRYVIVWKHSAPTISHTVFETFQDCVARAMEASIPGTRIYVYEYKNDRFRNEELIWDGEE